MAIPVDLIYKLLSVIIPASGIGAILVHFFASGNTIIKDRRLDKTYLYNKLEQLERQLELERDLTTVLFQRVNRLCWCWDANCEIQQSLVLAIENKESIPPMTIRALKACKKSEELIKDLVLPTIPTIPTTHSEVSKDA